MKLPLLVLAWTAATIGLVSGCAGDAQPQPQPQPHQVEQVQSEQPIIIQQDVDNTVEVSKLAFDLGDDIQLSIQYERPESDLARICFSASQRRTCRDGMVSSLAGLRPHVALEEAPNFVVVFFSIPNEENQIIWWSEDEIALNPGEYSCLVRNVPVPSRACDAAD